MFRVNQLSRTSKIIEKLIKYQLHTGPLAALLQVKLVHYLLYKRLVVY